MPIRLATRQKKVDRQEVIKLMTDEPKIQKAICERIMPLYEEWKSKAGLSAEESIVIWHKYFDPEKPNETTIQYILADEFDKSYEFYHRSKIHRIYKRARKKINKVLP